MSVSDPLNWLIWFLTSKPAYFCLQTDWSSHNPGTVVSQLDKNAQMYTDAHMHLDFVNILSWGFSIIQANCIVMGYSTFMNSGYLENELITRQMKDFNYSPPQLTYACAHTHTHTSDFSTRSFSYAHTLAALRHFDIAHRQTHSSGCCSVTEV